MQQRPAGEVHLRRKIIHLVCNAHIEPVWLCDWEEGVSVTLSTFRTAADLCEEFGAFVFNHNESLLYEWVEEYEPALFARIERLVRRGRWHVMGGWHLQPDCNMPAGESFVRQIRAGRTFFRQAFGVEPTTAVNFDPFGHTRGLVQILAKTGYDSYVVCRPGPADLALPDDRVVWVGFDGSEVLVHRVTHQYDSRLGRAREKVQRVLADHGDDPVVLVLWGVGNHGGGPSRKDLHDIERWAAAGAAGAGVDVVHSTPEAYMVELRRAMPGLPRWDRSIMPWAVGCYTSQSAVKRMHRRLEADLYATEKMAAAAVWARCMDWPADEVQAAERALLTAQFHDVLPGSSIRPVEDWALRLMGSGLETVHRIRARAFFALAASQRRAREGEYPILVYNPHPWPVTTTVAAEFQLAQSNKDSPFNLAAVVDDRAGEALPTQVEKELSNSPIEWRKVRGVDMVDAKAFQPIVVADAPDSWGMTTRRFGTVVGTFRLMSREAVQALLGGDAGDGAPSAAPVRIIEDGPVRTVVEAFFSWERSTLAQRYTIPRQGSELQVDTIVQWQARDVMLKLWIPLRDGPGSRFLGQTAFGVDELPVNGDEAVAHRWVAVANDERDHALTCVTDGTYGCDMSWRGLRLSLLRSAGYAAHPVSGWEPYHPTDRWAPRHDQGERRFRFWFDVGTVAERLSAVDRRAAELVEDPFVLHAFPAGGGRRRRPPGQSFLVLDDDVVQLSAVTSDDGGRSFLVRLFEPTGRPRRTTLTVPGTSLRHEVTLGPFEVATLRVFPRRATVRRVDMLGKRIRPTV